MMMFYLLSLLMIFSVKADVIEAPVNPIDYEQNPTSLQWKKIDTEYFEIIFPTEVSDEAQRVAALLEKVYPYVTRSLEVAPPKLSLVLQNQSVVSNGFVTLAPRRSEWYITPTLDPEIANTEWLKTLSIHEFRHVVQFHKTRRGFNKFLIVLLGEIGQAVGLGLTLPPWYLEGDAVGMETALTDGGRGRLPLFERDLRTLLLSGKDYKYDKTHLGSLKDYMPNHYVYGYFLTSSYRNQFGDLFLSKLADESAERSYNPLTFYNASERLTGESFEKFYENTMKNLVTEWKARLDKLTPTLFQVKNLQKRKVWTNYLYPQVTPDGKIFALKNGLSHISQFVVLDGKKEKTLFYPSSLMNEYPYKLRNGKVAFLESDPDPRWGYRDYSRLRIYDYKKERFILDKRKTKWRLAVLDPKASKVLVTEWSANQGQAVMILNMKGEIIARLPFEKEEVITSADWLDHDSIVLVVKDRKDLKKVVKLSFTEKRQDVILEPSFTNLGFITVEGGQILLESPASGIDNVYLLENGKLIQLTSSSFGAYAPTIRQGKLLYNDYSVNGMNVVRKELSWGEEQKSENSFYPVYEKFALNESKLRLSDELSSETKPYEIQEYSQSKHAINLHSWTILAPPLSNTITLVGYSRDILNKFSLSAGGNYNLNEHTTEGFVALSWSHLYPVFDFRLGYGGREQNVTVNGSEIRNKWEEGTAELGVQVPWRRITGRFNQQFSARAFSKIIQVTNKVSNDNTNVNDGSLFSPGMELQYSALSRTARRDLYPPLGISLDGHMEEGKDITGVDQKGSLLNGEARFYLPGFFEHHSLNQQLAYEKQRDDSYQYASLVLYPRGTRSTFLEEFVKYSGNYALPLFYPDWNLSRYFYLKRVSLNLFYDELNGRVQSFEYRAASTGWEVLFDTHLARIFLPISWGVRGSYVLKGLEKKENYEIFLTSLLGVF